jgi:hypothetical protein
MVIINPRLDPEIEDRAEKDNTYKNEEVCE